MQMNPNNPNETYTKDLAHAAALLTAGIKLIRLEREANFYWFVFDIKGANEVTNAYFSGELQQPVKQYSMNMRFLKDRLFAER
jgi:hypothetical protein